MALTCPGAYADDATGREIRCQWRHDPDGMHHAHDRGRCIVWTEGAAGINTAAECPNPPAHEVEQRAAEVAAKVKAARKAAKPATGRCPTGHGYTQHDAPTVTATALAEVLAAPSETHWRVYVHDAGQWQPGSAPYDTQDKAQWRQRQLAARWPDMPTAIVRGTTTYEED